ncbi:hypothetical protein [Pseudarthrobacter raffinosi]|uniref:hypothetical protein n=1 Tax=Pseudarthrobacter raffinosi TaxID=2953651 RepID=UPI0027E24EEA|nr:hypothetical protein [Pseudarthrobacter sp. MDT3-28]
MKGFTDESEQDIRAPFSVATAAGLALTVGCLTTPAAAVGPSAKPAKAGIQLDYLDLGGLLPAHPRASS